MLDIPLLIALALICSYCEGYQVVFQRVKSSVRCAAFIIVIGPQ